MRFEAKKRMRRKKRREERRREEMKEGKGHQSTGQTRVWVEKKEDSIDGQVQDGSS